jgi:hypothetical protein
MAVSVLAIPYHYAYRTATLYPAVLHNNKEKILVDCGYYGFMPLIQEAMQQYGL